MKTYFETKEQYLAFRAAWASAVNSPKAKSTYKPCDEWLSETDTYSEGTGTMRFDGWINVGHIVLFNILTGRKIDRGISPITNKAKLASGIKSDRAMRFARERIFGWNTKIFLEPFAGTVTVDMLEQVRDEWMKEISHQMAA